MIRSVTMWTLGFLGWVLSYAMFVKWLVANRWDFFGGWAEAFTSSDFATGLLIDLVLVTLMMVALAVFDRRRLGTRWTVAVLASVSLSVSMSLAIYLAAILFARQGSGTQQRGVEWPRAKGILRHEKRTKT